MKNFLVILLYIIGFSIAAILSTQIPAVLLGEEFFLNDQEMILSAIAGVACGLIVAFFNLRKIDNKN